MAARSTLRLRVAGSMRGERGPNRRAIAFPQINAANSVSTSAPAGQHLSALALASRVS